MDVGMRGAPFVVLLHWTSAGVPVDLSGWSALLQVRDSSGAVLVELSDGAGITLGGDGPGTVRVEFDGLATASLPVRQALVYDLRLEEPGGSAVYLVEGPVAVRDPVTVPG